MNFLNFLQREKPKITNNEGTPPPQQDTSQTAKGGSFGSVCGVEVNSPSSALDIAAFQRAIVLRANTISQLKWQYQKVDKTGGNYVEDTRGEEARRINYLLQIRPNPLMNAPAMFRQTMMDVDLQGNAVIYIERDIVDFSIRRLWLCSSASYDIIKDRYAIAYNMPGGMVVKTVESYEVIHLKSPISDDHGLSGVSLLRHGKKILGLAATNDALVYENASKGGKLKLLVQEEKKMGLGLGMASKKEIEKVTRQLNDDIYNQDVVCLSNVVGVTPISQNMQQQGVQMSRQFSVKEIARITGVPPILLMDESGGSYKSPEAATQEFLLRSIAPIIREWEAEVNSKLLGFEGYGTHRFHLCEKPLLRLDPIGSANVAKIQLETGQMSVNELRKEQDMPTVEGGDKVLVSTNLQEVSKMKVNTAKGKGTEGGES